MVQIDRRAATAATGRKGSSGNSGSWPALGPNGLRWGLLILVLLASAWVWWPQGRVYPTVTSPESLSLIKQLYTACSSRSAEGIDVFEQAVTTAEDAGQVTPAESTAFRSIVATARAGDWEQASRDSFRFAEDQVRR